MSKKGGDDVSSNIDSNVILSTNTAKGANETTSRAFGDSMEEYANPIFVGVRDDYYHYEHKSSLSLQDSMIDSSNVESLSLVSDCELDSVDSPHRGQIKNTTNAQNDNKLKHRPNQNTETPAKLSPSDGQINAFDSLDQEGITVSNNISTDTASELTLGHNCFLNVGRHLAANAGQPSAQTILSGKDSDSPDPSRVGDGAANILPNDVSTNVKASHMSSLWNAFLSCVAIITLLSAIHWSHSDDEFVIDVSDQLEPSVLQPEIDEFVIDVSVDLEPSVLQPEIAAKLDYYISKRGTAIHILPHNINIGRGYASQHKEEWPDFIAQEESDFHPGGPAWFRFLPTILRNVAFLFLFLCACLQIRRLLSLLPPKQTPLSSTPLRVKKCTKELSSLEKVVTFGSWYNGSWYQHEIIRNDGSTSKVRRSTRILLSPQRKIVY